MSRHVTDSKLFICCKSQIWHLSSKFFRTSIALFRNKKVIPKKSNIRVLSLINIAIFNLSTILNHPRDELFANTNFWSLFIGRLYLHNRCSEQKYPMYGKWRGVWKKVLSDSWCSMKFSHWFTSTRKANWKEYLAVYQKTPGILFPVPLHIYTDFLQSQDAKLILKFKVEAEVPEFWRESLGPKIVGYWSFIWSRIMKSC